MDEIRDKRVFAESTTAISAYVAADIGVVNLQLGDTRIGEFRLVLPCTAFDITVIEGEVVVATDEDVFVGSDETFHGLGFGPAVAVGGDDDIIAGGPDGRVARFVDDTWIELGWLNRITAIADGFIGTSDGLFQSDGLSPTGLSGINDIATGRIPHAATDAGLYSLGNGWQRELKGGFWCVTADSHPGGQGLLASTPTDCYHNQSGGWEPFALPGDASVVDGVFADGIYLLTYDGAILSTSESEWRKQLLGVRRAIGIEIPERKKV